MEDKIQKDVETRHKRDITTILTVQNRKCNRIESKKIKSKEQQLGFWKIFYLLNPQNKEL